MEIGISTATYFGKELTEDTFKLINGMKIPICEVFLTTFSEYTPEFCDLLLERKGEVEVYSVHTLNQQFEPELFNNVPRTRQNAERFFIEAGVTAGKLGAKYYTFHGPSRIKPRPYNHNYPLIGARLNELDALLMSVGNGCRLTYETVHWAHFANPDFFENVKKYCDTFACLDIKQVMQSNIELEMYIKAIGDRLKNVHLCDYDSSGRLYAPGQGEFDFTTFFKRLYDIGYDGPMMMELYSGDYKDYGEIERSYEYLKNCLEIAKRSNI
ncbi:MAG: sugar phosphate isomerase/epimerase [Bacillota bacterium]